MTGIQIRGSAGWIPVVRPWFFVNGWNRARQVLVFDGSDWERVWPAGPAPALTIGFSPALTTFREGQSVTLSSPTPGAVPQVSRDGGQTWRDYAAGFPTVWVATVSGGPPLTWRARFPGSDSQAPGVSQSYPTAVVDAAPLTVSVTGTGFTEAERHQDGSARFDVSVAAGGGAPLPVANRVIVQITRPDGLVYTSSAVPVDGRSMVPIRESGYWPGTWNVRIWVESGDGFAASNEATGSWMVQRLVRQTAEWAYSSRGTNGTKMYLNASTPSTSTPSNVQIAAGLYNSNEIRSFVLFGPLGKPAGATGPAWAVAARMRLRPLWSEGDTKDPRLWHVGWHTSDPLPATGALSAAGVNQAQWLIQTPHQGRDSDIPIRAINTGGSFWSGLNNGSFRGLVFGGKWDGKEQEYSYARSPVELWVTWQWDTWEDAS